MIKESIDKNNLGETVKVFIKNNTKNNLNFSYFYYTKAFTVMEVVIVAMISVLVLGALYNFWMRTQENFIQGNFKYIVQHEAHKLIDMLRQDILQSCKIIKDETDVKLPVITTIGDSWSFLKFSNEFVQGKPLVERITYEFKKNEKKVYRLVERNSKSSLAKNENKLIAERIIDLQINPYTLNNLKYFQIKIKAGVSATETHIRGEEFILITSVESKFDNNYLKQPGWIDNIQTVIYTN